MGEIREIFSGGGHVDWVVYDDEWGTFSEPHESYVEAKNATHNAGDVIFKREWTRVG